MSGEYGLAVAAGGAVVLGFVAVGTPGFQPLLVVLSLACSLVVLVWLVRAS